MVKFTAAEIPRIMDMKHNTSIAEVEHEIEALQQKLQEWQMVEDVKEDEEHDDDVDDSDDDKDELVLETEDSKQSRSEKKCRLAMLKLGMKPLFGVNTVTIKRTENTSLSISKPDVFKCPNSETYVIFGEAKIEDLSSQLQTQAAQQFKAEIAGTADAEANDEEEEDVDETGVEPRDIDLVMTYVGVSRSKAVNAIKTHNGDIVSAIMELTP